MEMNKALIDKAKETKTVEELSALAKESGIQMTEEEAKAYFEQLHPKTGELSDEELDNVAGGGCYAKNGKLVVSAMHQCGDFRCKKDDGTQHQNITGPRYCSTCGIITYCFRCKYCSYENGLWLCNHPEKVK